MPYDHESRHRDQSDRLAGQADGQQDPGRSGLTGMSYVQQVEALQPGGAPEQVSVTASRLRVRSTPSTRNNRNVLGGLSRGATVPVAAEQEPWLRVPYEGQEGWIHGGYTTPVAQAAAPEAASDELMLPVFDATGSEAAEETAEAPEAAPSGGRVGTDAAPVVGEERETEDEGGGGRAATDPAVAAILERWPEGILVTFYADHEGAGTADSNDREIRRRAVAQADALGAVGLDGSTIALGVANPITDYRQIAEGLEAICSTLRAGMSEADVAADRWKVGNFLVYAHGWETGLGTGAGVGRNLSMQRIEGFISSIGGYLRGDVHVSLNACSTASADAGTEGEDSFADAMRDELANQGHEGATLSGHYTAGHTTGNPNARVFGGDFAGEETEGGGVHFFDHAFSAADVEAEAQTRGLEAADCRSQMMRWYNRYVAHWRTGVDRGERFDVGLVIMVDPSRAVQIIRDAWAGASGFRDYSHRPHIDLGQLGRPMEREQPEIPIL